MLYFLSRQAGFYNVWGIHFDSTAGRVTGDRFRVTTFDSPNQMVLLFSWSGNFPQTTNLSGLYSIKP